MPGEKDLHPYQKFCVDFLEEKPQCALFLDCGLGKTIITLTAISHPVPDEDGGNALLVNGNMVSVRRAMNAAPENSVQEGTMEDST